MRGTTTKRQHTSAFGEHDWLGPWARPEHAASDIADVTIDQCELPHVELSERCAAIYVHGPLLASHTAYVGKLVDQAAGLDECDRIMLIIGGSNFGQAEGIESTMHKIWRARRSKLFWSYVRGCTGAAYLLAAATSHIFAGTELQMQIGGLTRLGQLFVRRAMSPSTSSIEQATTMVFALPLSSVVSTSRPLDSSTSQPRCVLCSASRIRR